MPTGFGNTAVDIVDRLEACAEVDEEEGAQPDVVAMTREAAATVKALREERDLYAAKAAGTLDAGKLKLMGELIVIQADRYKLLMEMSGRLATMAVHAQVQAGMSLIWDKPFTDREGALQTALRQLHDLLLPAPKKKAHLLVLPGGKVR